MNEEEQNQQKAQKNLPEQLASMGGQAAKNAAEKTAKSLARQATRKMVEKLAQVAAKVAAKVVAFIIAHIIPIAIIVAVIIVISVLIPAIDNYLNENTSETIDEVTYQALKDYTTVDETGIHFDKEELLKGIVVSLGDAGIDLNGLGFGDDGSWKMITNTVNGSSMEIDYDSQAAKYLYEFVTAALAGELPYIPGSDPEAQGIVSIKRKKDDQEAKDLTYIGYEQFQEMLKTTDSAVKDDSVNYFSLDESWNLCIAKPYRKTVNKYKNKTLIETQSEYTISEIKIPYRNMVSQYAVPFLFLIDLQIVTANANYVSAVADLMTKQSFIEFTVFDQITTRTDIYNYTADRYSRNPVPVGDHIEGGGRGQTAVSGPHDVDDKTETIVETDHIKASVTKAKTWIIEQETNYEMQENREYPYTENGETNSLEDQNDPHTIGSWDKNREEYLYTEIIKREWVKTGDTQTTITPSEFMGLWSNESGRYIQGAPYKPIGENKSGKLVGYKMLAGNSIGYPAPDIMTNQEELYDMLESSLTTQIHAELMREMIRVYQNGEEIEQGTFYTSAFTSMYEPFEYVEGSYVGNFDVHDPNLFITDIELLKKAFGSGYSKGDKLVLNAQAFLDMQETYQVNAIFAAAVSITETGAGRAGNAINGCHNWFNISGTGGPYITKVNKKGEVYHWRKYKSDHEGIDAFGNLIANGKYYYTQGKTTVADIGYVYCPNTAIHPTQADDWIEETLAQMARFYEAAGIDITSIIQGGNIIGGSDFGYDLLGDAMADPKFAAMLAEAKKHLGLPYVWGGSSPDTGFDCSGFVSWVINESGVGSVGRQTANGLRKFCAYVPKDEAKPGDLIFFQNTYNTAGASHVGIYIGNGKMIHCGNPVQEASIETNYWQSHFLDFGRLQ